MCCLTCDVSVSARGYVCVVCCVMLCHLFCLGLEWVLGGEAQEVVHRTVHRRQRETRQQKPNKTQNRDSSMRRQSHSTSAPPEMPRFRLYVCVSRLVAYESISLRLLT